MNKIAEEMFESCLRELIWQASEELGPRITARLLSEVQREYSHELASFATEQGVILTKPPREL